MGVHRIATRSAQPGRPGSAWPVLCKAKPWPEPGFCVVPASWQAQVQGPAQSTGLVYLCGSVPVTVTARPRCSGLEVVVVGQLQGASVARAEVQLNGPIPSVPHASHQPRITSERLDELPNAHAHLICLHWRCCCLCGPLSGCGVTHDDLSKQLCHTKRLLGCVLRLTAAEG